MKTKTIFFFVIIVIFTMSCKNELDEAPYGVRFNEERKKIGLILIEKDWISESNESSGLYFWYPPISDSSKQVVLKAYYAAKRTLIKDNVMASESDVFINDKERYTLDFGEQNTCLMYIYSFFPSQITDSGNWSYFLITDPKKKKS